MILSITSSEHQYDGTHRSLNNVQQFNICDTKEKKPALVLWMFDEFSNNLLEETSEKCILGKFSRLVS